MKANLIFVFLVLAPMLLRLFAVEVPEERVTDRPPTAEAEAKPTPPPPPAPAPAKQPEAKAQPAPGSGGGSAEPQRPERLPAQDAVTFM